MAAAQPSPRAESRDDDVGDQVDVGDGVQRAVNGVESIRQRIGREGGSHSREFFTEAKTVVMEI